MPDFKEMKKFIASFLLTATLFGGELVRKDQHPTYFLPCFVSVADGEHCDEVVYETKEDAQEAIKQQKLLIQLHGYSLKGLKFKIKKVRDYDLAVPAEPITDPSKTALFGKGA